jgi:hypothetical protein
MARKKTENPAVILETCKIDRATLEEYTSICKKKGVGRSTVTRELIKSYVEENRDLIKQ